jgi:uncharacterized protein (DUF983 family)
MRMKYAVQPPQQMAEMVVVAVVIAVIVLRGIIQLQLDWSWTTWRRIRLWLALRDPSTRRVACWRLFPIPSLMTTRVGR